MKKSKTDLLMGAAITGIVSAAIGFTNPAVASGKDNSKPPKKAAAKGAKSAEKIKCFGANLDGCKGTAICGYVKIDPKTKKATNVNSCHGQNPCKGMGALKMTKAECDKIQAKRKKMGVKM